jgi:hypothetical protein
MNPKSGSAGSAVEPTEPAAAKEAVTADPGKAGKVADGENSSQADPFDSEKMEPHKPPQQSVDLPAGAGASGGGGGGGGGAGAGAGAGLGAGAGTASNANQSNQKKSWIEIEMVDEDNNPVPGEKYRIILTDNKTFAEGTLDEKGFARVEGIEPGSCKVTFPKLDKDAWEKV